MDGVVVSSIIATARPDRDPSWSCAGECRHPIWLVGCSSMYTICLMRHARAPACRHTQGIDRLGAWEVVAQSQSPHSVQ